MIPESRTGLNCLTADEKRELYIANPELFDKLAAEAIKQACIAETPEETLKLQQMQWAIDARLKKAKSPLERMQTMENIFYGQLFGSNGNLAHLVDYWSELAHTAKEPDEVPTAKQALLLVKR
jgi:hypothetical protein